jgi:hypothetical protein
VDDGPVRNRVGTVDDVLPHDAVRDTAFDLRRSGGGDHVAEDLASVLTGLEQPRDVGGVRRANGSGVIFQFGEVEQPWRQGLAERLPPASRLVRRHLDQGFDESLVGARVQAGQGSDAVGAHAEPRHFDVGELPLTRPEGTRCLG